jgi:endonuclease/exonuclease/phosphatase family metal-dependent hydrolase
MPSFVSRVAFCVLIFVAPCLGARAEALLRIMAANISSGNNQSYDPGHGTRIFQGLDPDIVLIQEFNYGDNSTTAIRGWVDSAFGTSFQYYREGGAQIPNGIVSRYPIIASGEWDDTSVTNRDFAWARIDIPGPKDLWAISVHLLTSSSSVRNTEATALRNFINANVPAGDYLVVGGDFNTDSRTEAALSTLSSVVVTASPYPADQNNNSGTNATRAKPYDWVLVDNDLHPYRVATVIGSQSFANGLVFDSRVFTPLSAVSPVQSTDSSAINMQHMAVVRDFFVPDGGGTPPTATLAFGTQTTATVTAGNWIHYTIDVPADSTTVTLTMTGSGGDADLYVRKAGQPTSGSYDFRPYLNGSNETVSITSSTTPPLSSGTWYVSVYGYSTATYALTPARTTGASGAQTLLDTTDTANAGAWKNYTVTVPTGKTKMTVTMTGSNGDADLYIKKAAPPTASSYDFRPYLDGSNETVVINATTTPPLSSGTWFIAVNGYSTATYTLKAVVE